jgi:DNA-binding PadR family transcriptional regulator
MPDEVKEDICDKLERNRRRYGQSDLGKASTKRWNDSDSGRAARKKYLESEKGQEALLRWALSEKAQTAKEKRKSMVKLFQLTDKYLQEHLGATIEEALEEITKVKEV